MTERNTKTITLRLPVDLAAWLEELASEQTRSVNNLLIVLLNSIREEEHLDWLTGGHERKGGK